eukprot:1558862-Alexandrium_andersonii.AAC.1
MGGECSEGERQYRCMLAEVATSAHPPLQHPRNSVGSVDTWVRESGEARSAEEECIEALIRAAAPRSPSRLPGPVGHVGGDAPGPGSTEQLIAGVNVAVPVRWLPSTASPVTSPEPEADW